MNKYRQALSQLPALLDMLRNVDSAQTELNAVTAAQEEAREAFQMNLVGVFLHEDPEDAIKKVFARGNSVDNARELMSKIGNDPDAKAGIPHEP